MEGGENNNNIMNNNNNSNENEESDSAAYYYLAPHPATTSACGLLRALLHVIEQSPTPPSQRSVEAAPLLSALLDPIANSLEHLLHFSQQQQQQLHKIPSAILSSYTIFSINTLCVALSSVLPYEFSSSKQQILTDMLESSITRYIEAATERTMVRLELDVALRLMKQKPRPSKDSAALSMKVFFAGIFAGEGICPLPVPHLENIQPVRVRERCRKEIVAKVCEVYDEIYEIVAKDIEQDDGARKMILHHTPEQLRMLLE